MGLRALAVVAGLVGAAAVVDAQPPFPHKYHVEEEGLECADCHGAAYSSRSAADDLLPDNELCLDCHDEGDVRMSWPAAARDYDFDHRHHVEALGMECATCHQGLEIEAVRTTGYLPSMNDCMTCHTGAAASRDCESCHHADVAALIPEDHGVDWKHEHGPVASMNDATCMPCHAVDDCQACHDGGLLVEQMSLGASRQTPFATELVGGALTALQRVHGLNWRFLHGLEARGKSTDCLTCHDLDSGDFCADCHNPAGDAGIRPAWHGVGTWTTLGAGSGGGRHGEMARRDIEMCAACHEPRGDDPVCLQCHVDRTPGRGNDPRTHDADFADDVGDGDFHDDESSLCYTCHTRSAADDGFCNYCHAAP
jgi:hypothetical protein